MKKARIIFITCCLECPYLYMEENEKDVYCWVIEETIFDLQEIHKDCPLEEVDLESEIKQNMKTDD